MKPATTVRFALIALLLNLYTAPVQAERLLMARVDLPFPEAMNDLQQTIQANGYQVSRVQRVDIGLTGSGYQTAEYRIVFFGKQAEIKKLSARYPELIPYLPLKIVIFAENDQTLLVANNYQHLQPSSADWRLRRQLKRWNKDIQTIFDRMHLRQAQKPTP